MTEWASWTESMRNFSPQEKAVVSVFRKWVIRRKVGICTKQNTREKKERKQEKWATISHTHDQHRTTTMQASTYIHLHSKQQVLFMYLHIFNHLNSVSSFLSKCSLSMIGENLQTNNLFDWVFLLFTKQSNFA
jgi:hypothetical protein